MASRLAIVLALAALPSLAHAQSAPDEPAPAPAPGGLGAASENAPPPPPSPAPDEKPAEPPPPPPEAPPPEAPPPQAPPPAEPAKPEDKPAATPKAHERIGGFDSVLVGFGLGVAGATGTPSEVYPASYGAQLALGLARGPLELEARVALGYGAMPKQSSLRGDTTRASLTLHSVVARVRLPVDPVSIGVFAGLASGEVPVLVAGADMDHPDKVGPSGIEGVGATFGGSVHYRFSKYGEVLAELALYHLAWELPGHGYVVHPMSADGVTTTVETSTDDISATPWSFTVSVRGIISD